MKRVALLAVFCLALFSSVLAQKDTIKYPDSWTDGQNYIVNGARLWVVTAGKGEPLIIIPGGPRLMLETLRHLPRRPHLPRFAADRGPNRPPE